MATRYRFSLKSQEDRGATQPNIAYIELASDADAAIFAANLEAAFSAHVVTYTSELSTDYSLPYPAGTGVLARCQFWGTDFTTYNAHLRELKVGADVEAMAAGMIANGLLMPNSAFSVPDSINVTVIKPGTSF